jgi:hypothetical protein
MPFYQAKLVRCRFVPTKFSPLVEYVGKSNATVTWTECITTTYQAFDVQTVDNHDKIIH